MLKYVSYLKLNKFELSSKLVNYSSTFSTSNEYATDINRLKSKYDVVIIGCGHNGLVAANYLAKFSKKKLSICMLEKRHVIGGAAVTEEIVPGFKFSRASYLLSLFRPVILKDLDLMRHNMLKFYLRNPSSYTPLLESDPQYRSNRTSLTLSSESDFNYKQIAKFSAKDASNYEKYNKWLHDICQSLEGFLDKAPPSLKKLKEKKSLLAKIMYLKSFINNIEQAKFFALNYEDIYRLLTEPTTNLLDEWFESDVLKATLATDSVIGALISPKSAGSAYVLLHHIIGGVDGKAGAWAYVEGGMGSISNCLAFNAKTEFKDQIDIFVSQEVDSIELDETNTKSKGVLLKNGKFIESSFILSNCTPHVTFTKLLEKYQLHKHSNENVSKFFKRIDKINYDSGTMKINLAVNKLPSFKADPNLSENDPMPHHQTTIHINCENMNLIDGAYTSLKLNNKPSKRPVIEMVIPSSLDPTLAPKNSHVILLFCQYFPMDKLTNEITREKYANLVLDSIENYAPGFKKSIIGKDILTPYDLETKFGLTGGNIFHGAMPLSQLFINRPVSEWQTYTTPIENLYLAGSGAHPGGGVMGSPGRNCALECLSKIN